MIRHNLKIFLQNIRKNKILTDIILETQKNLADVIFIQEPLRFLVRHIPSYSNPMGDPLYSISNHPDWILFTCQDTTQENYARVITYVNKYLAKMRFALQLDIINHHDINVLVFYNDRDTNYIINIYSDSSQTALQVLWQNMANIDNTIILTGDFNIRDSDWDPSFRHHSSHTDNFITITDSLSLELSPPSNPGPTRFEDNPYDTNSIIVLVFLPPGNIGFG